MAEHLERAVVALNRGRVRAAMYRFPTIVEFIDEALLEIDQAFDEHQQRAVLLAAHQEEFLAEYRRQFPSPDGDAGAAEALADFERDALQHDESRGRTPEAVSPTTRAESS